MRNTYPSFGLNEALNGAKRLYDAVKDKVMNREELIGLLQYGDSGRANNFVGSLSHYGLLQRNGYEYRLTNKAMMFFGDPKGKAALRHEFATKPVLFKSLDKKYGTELPNNIATILKEEFRVPDNRTKLVIKNYRDAMISTGERKQTVTNNKDVSIDFGNGFIVQVPKRIVLKAYLEELQKIANILD